MADCSRLSFYYKIHITVCVKGSFGFIWICRSKTETMDKGIEAAKLQQRAIANQVQSFLDMNQIISAGPFLYGFVQEVFPYLNVHLVKGVKTRL